MERVVWRESVVSSRTRSMTVAVPSAQTIIVNKVGTATAMERVVWRESVVGSRTRSMTVAVPSAQTIIVNKVRTATVMERVVTVYCDQLITRTVPRQHGAGTSCCAGVER